jgi:hypothetical protein
MPAWSGLFDDVNVGGHSLQSNNDKIKSSITRGIAKIVRRNRRVKEILREAVNVDITGVTLSADHTRVIHKEASGEFGGSRTMETVDDLNVTGVYATHGHPIRDLLDASPSPTYPTDASGNGGGGKAGDI